MLNSHFYHEIIRKTIVSFGTLFNGIEIKHDDRSGGIHSIVKVPISYGPQQKFLARLEQNRDLVDGPARAITLPRMSFEMVGIQYDAGRKVSTMQTFKAVNKETSKMIKGFMPVPYNITFQLSILSKLNEDAIQILEQILPFFQPTFNLTIDLVSTIGEKRDMPITLESISMDDNYEADFLTRRALIYTLNFTCKTYMFGPVDQNTGLIKEVKADLYTDTANLKTGSRQMRYSVTPVAVKDVTQDDTARTNQEIDDKHTEFSVNSAVPFSKDDFIQIDGEVMRITRIIGDRLQVLRGQFSTQIEPHDLNVRISAINVQDTEQVVEGDDFGFSETREFYDSQGDVYSNSTTVDSAAREIR